MGTGDKPGFFASKLTTIILIVLLAILVVVFIVIQATGGFEEFFSGCKKKKSKDPSLKRPGVSMNQKLHSPGELPSLELVGNGFIALTETELS